MKKIQLLFSLCLAYLCSFTTAGANNWSAPVGPDKAVKGVSQEATATFEDGKYYIIVGHRFESGLYDDNGVLTSTRYYATNGVPTELTIEKDAKHIWQLHANPNGEGFFIQNYVSKQYAAYPWNPNSTVPVKPEGTSAFVITPNTVTPAFAGYFNICPTENKSTGWAVSNGNNYTVIYWGGLAADDANQYKFYEVSDDVIKNFENNAEQAQLNKELKDVYFSASYLYNKARVYTANGALNDGIFSIPADGLVTDAAQITANAKQANEGTIEGLLDGKLLKVGSDQTYYFCSPWSGNALPAGEYPHFDIDLGTETQIVTLKYAGRIGANSNSTPNRVNIYATNDADAAARKWNLIGTYAFNNDVACTFRNSVDEAGQIRPKTGGMTGFDLGCPYRYIRMEVTNTVCLDVEAHHGGNWYNGVPIFTMAELRAYPGTFDEAASKQFMAVSEPVRNALNEKLQAATTAYNDGKATREIIDELRKAYADFAAEFSYPEADKYLASLSETKVGGYKTQDLNALKKAYDNAKADATTENITALVDTLRSIEFEKYKPIAIDPAKYYRVVFTGDNSVMGSYNAYGDKDGNLSTDEAALFVQAAEKAPAATVLWQFVRNGNDYRLKNVNTGKLLGRVANDKLSLAADDANAGVYAVEAGNGKIITDRVIKDTKAESDKAYLNISNNIGLGAGAGDVVENVLNIVEVKAIDVTIGTAGYATLNLPVAVSLPTGMKAYYVTGNKGNELVLKEIEGTIPANTAVILEGAAATYAMPIIAAGGAAPTDNLLTGTLIERRGMEAETYYGLGNVDAAIGVAFYLATSAVAPANKAILFKDVLSTDAKALRFGGSTTGIDGITSADNAKANIYYDLNGRRVAYPSKGIYINGNGQKVFIK